MKKMIVLFAITLMVGLAQAAFVNWAIDYGKADGAGKTYYVFDGSKSADVLSILGAVDGDSASKLGDLAYATGTLNTKAGKASGNGLDVGSSTSLMMVVLDSDLSAGATYKYDTMDVSSMLYTPPASAPGAFTASNAMFTQSGTMVKAGGGGDVPEPTSGLLLLVGGAMLALRRKQK